MGSLILRTASRFLLGLLLVLSLFVLLRGHDEPGGGFIGGLLAASAFALHALANDTASARRLLRFDPRTYVAVGLGCALGAGLVGSLVTGAFLRGLWTPFVVPGLGKIGTALLFDVGVYLVVLGTTVLVLFTLDEED